jgi:translocation and assembly module TamB
MSTLTLRRTFNFILLSVALVLFTPAHSEITLSASASLDTFSYDLDNIHLKLEKLSARWQLSPFGNGKLQVEQLKAKRLIITMRDNGSNSPLPNRINLPFPISIERAEITEVVIVSADNRQTLTNVQFNFEGDAKTLRLKLNRANTPWGDASANLNVNTSKPFALTGAATLKQLNADLPYDVKVLLSGDFNTLAFESSAWLALQNSKLAIWQDSSAIQAAAHIVANGQLSLANDYPITVNARMTEVHPERLYPAQLADYPTAQLNIDLDLQGKLLPAPTATLQFALRDSQWQNQALTGSGNLLIAYTKTENTKIDGTQIQQLDFQLGLATNSIQANGSLGKPDSHLDWQAALPNLAAFNQDYAGEAHASGSIEGSFDNLALHANLLAQNLTLSRDLKIDQLEGQATIETGASGIVAGELKAGAIHYGQHPALSGQVKLKGTRSNHQLLIMAQGPDVQFESALQGGLSNGNIWQGFLQQLSYTGKIPVKLSAPAPLHIDSNSVTLEQAVIQLAKGRASVELLQVGNGKLISKGQLSQLTLADLPAGIFNLPNTLQGSPVFSGKWDLSANDTLNGNFSLWRDTDDFTLTSANGTSSPLGLTEAKIELNILNNNAELLAKLDGQNLGNLNAKLATTLTKTEAGFALLASAPLTLNGTAQLNTLAWLPMPTSLMDAYLDGQLALSVSANGTLGKPNLSGNVTGQNLHFSLPSEGVNLNKGSLLAEFQNDQLRIKQASWQGGAGSLNTSGVLLMDHGKPKIDLDWHANNFTLLSRTDRLLTLSGTGKTTLADGMFTILGKFTVNKGLIELSKEDAPALDDDVVILGQVTSIKKPSLKILLNGLHIDLGQDFTLRGRGLDAELIGSLTLTGLTQYRPHTEGSIQVKKGTYMAYGQVLNIERGILNFNGPMDNPGLNIRAMRNSKPVNAGVEITGSAFMPVTKLVSDPNVTETEKLSWLVLGHGMDQAGKNDYGMLSLAAGVLLSQGQSVPLQTQLARAAGLDEFSFAGGDAESATLVFGKRLTSQLYLSYEKSVSGLLDVARLTFNITPRWSLRAEAGTDSAVDVLYTFSFK